MDSLVDCQIDCHFETLPRGQGRDGTLAAMPLLTSCAGAADAGADAPSTSPVTATAAPSTSPAPTVVVPDLSGLTGDAARERLVADEIWHDFIFDGDFASSTQGTIVESQDPPAGARIDPEDVVTVNLVLPPAPPYEVQEDGAAIDVTVDASVTQGEAQLIVSELMDDYRPDGAYFVSINCSVGGTASADDRLANSRFAIGERGAALTDLQAGTQETELVEGATCP